MLQNGLITRHHVFLQILDWMDTYSHVLPDMQNQGVSAMESALLSLLFHKLLTSVILIVVRDVGDGILNGKQSCAVVEAHVKVVHG